MMLDVLLSSFMAAGSGPSMFGNEVGNGGDVVLCPALSGGPTVSVLDYFEARKMMPQLPLDLQGHSAAELVERALKRLERLDPARADRYNKHAAEILGGGVTHFLSGIVLRDIADSGYVPLGECKIRQAVIQKEPWHPLDRRYAFDADIWQMLPTGDQAGLILHEVIYREVIELGQRNSSAVRQLVAWLSSPLFDRVTPEQYADIAAAVFFVPKLLAFNQERITLYAERGRSSSFELWPFVAYEQGTALTWSLDNRSPATLSMSQDGGQLLAELNEEATGIFRTSVTVSSGILWDVVPVDVVAIKPGDYPPRWLADEFEIQLSKGEAKKVFDLTTLARDESGDMLQFRMVSGPKTVSVTDQGVVHVDQTFEGRSRVEVSAFNESGWTQGNFVVERE